ncbi:hypothetical protein [Nostoc sp.]
MISISEIARMRIGRSLGETLAGVEIEALFFGCGICTPTFPRI